MPKKNMTEAEKKAWGEKMKAARKAKKTADQIAEHPPVADENNVDTLLKRIEELEKGRFFQQTPVTRSVTRYSVNPKDYPDPRERLSREPRLERHAFRHNFELSWKVGKVNYDHDGVHYTEPKFQLELNRIIMDEDGNPTAKRYRVCKGTFFEDPDGAVMIAHERGIDVEEELRPDFLNEMRYLQMRDWLLEAFYPPKPIQAKKNRHEEVIGNRLVEVFEINSDTPEEIPISQLKGRV